MDHHESVNVEWNLYCKCGPWQKSSVGKRSMYIHICGWHTFCFGALFVIRWHRWRFGPRWRRSGLWCTLAFAPPACLWIFAVPFWQGMQPSVWFSRTFAGCLSIAAFTLLCPGNSTLRFFSSRTSARGFLISCCISSIAARENPPLAMLAIFKARRMSDCSSCTWPPCLAIVADMLKTSRKLVAASAVRSRDYLNHIRLHSLLWGLLSLFHPFPGTFITIFVCENPRTDNLVISNFADCADKCLGRPWRFAVTGSDELVTELSTYASSALYS